MKLVKHDWIGWKGDGWVVWRKTYSARRAITGCLLFGAATQAIAQAAPPPANPSTPSAPSDKSTKGSTNDATKTADPGAIVVTATRRAENLMKIPVAVSAYTGATLEKLGVTGVQAIQVATPAVTFPNTGAFAQPYIRGVGSRLLQNGFDPSVAVYTDGRYLSRQSAIVFDLVDIDRVEVLKGPQGVLFGRNSSAGAIRIITADVSKNLGGYVKGGYGNYNQWNLEGALNVPLTDTLGIRISGETTRRDGYAKNLIPTGRKNWDDKNFNYLRGKIRWEPTNWYEARLSGSYWHENDDDGNAEVAVGRLDLTTGIAKGGITGVGPSQVATQLDGTNNKKEAATELDQRFRLGFADLTATTTYSYLKNILTFDADGTSAPVTDAIVYENSKTFSQELQLASVKGGPLDWLVGAYYYYDNSGYEATFDQGAVVNSNGQQQVVTKSLAGYGQLIWHATDRLSFIAGGRYTKDKKNLGLFASDHHPVFRGIISNPATPFEKPYFLHNSWAKFTPSATVQYDLDDTLLYAKFSRGFKSGGYNYPAAPPLANLANVPPIVKPETLDMYELGLKGRYFDRKLQLTLAGYYYDYSNLQVTAAAASGVTSIVTTRNAANAILYGLDADATWFVTPQLTLMGAVALEHSEYKNFIADAKVYRALLPGAAVPAVPGMVDVGFDASGQQLLRAPNFSAFASVNYDVLVGPGKIPVTLSYAFKSSFNFDFAYDPPGITQTGSTSVLKQRPYSLVNGRIAYSPNSGRWTAGVWVNNLFNKKYFVDVVAAGPGIRASYAAPRTYGVDLQYKF